MPIDSNHAFVKGDPAALAAITGPDAYRLFDPLEPDGPADGILSVSKRGLARLALVASETGMRFARDEIKHEPMAWLLAPRRLFDGRSAIEACLERKGCTRAVMLHSPELGFGLDADADAVDSLIEDEEDEPHLGSANGFPVLRLVGGRGELRLFTATVVGHSDLGHVHAFGAAVVGCADEMRELLGRHLGEELARAADVFEGFRPGTPLVDAMLSETLVDMLRLVESDPTSPLADGMEVMLQQRFAA